ncbi:MAG: glycosyltransferase family 2 protein [Deltaproteobacteria bacterium]|nr:glycosyltransferase family 2 protein [Deltaproteobacteria bacterium]
MNPRLSICLPTYNRASFLRGALESICTQATDDLEIVVSDNASTDDTPGVVADFARRYPFVRGHRHEANLGFDRNFKSLVELAKGAYCWTLGDDDWLEPGALAKVYGGLDARPGVTGMTVQANGYSAQGQLIAATKTTGALEYVRGAGPIFQHRRLGFLFGNMSIHVFRRDRAGDVLSRHRLFENGCSCHHLFSLLVRHYQDWAFLDEPCVAWRYGNDSFAQDGLYRRARLALRGYTDIVGEVFGRDSEVFREFMDVQQTHVARRYVIRAKNVNALNRHYGTYRCDSSERWRINSEAFVTLYKYPRYWRQVAPWTLVPGPILSIILRTRQLLRHESAALDLEPQE